MGKSIPFADMPRKTSRKTRQYTPDDRRAAARAFASTGSITRASKLVGIPHPTIYGWSESDEDYIATLNSCRQSATQAHVQTYLNLITQAQEQMADRLENGDYCHRHGELHRIPVSLMAAASAMSICQDKAQLLQRRPTSITAGEDRLEALAQRLGEIARAAQAKTVEGEVMPSKAPASPHSASEQAQAMSAIPSDVCDVLSDSSDDVQSICIQADQTSAHVSQVIDSIGVQPLPAKVSKAEKP